MTPRPPFVHRGDGIRHELRDTAHASVHDAQRAAYGTGLLGVMVYDDEAALNSFPTGERAA